MNGDDTSNGTGRARSSGADRARDEIIADLDARLRRHEADTHAKLDQLDTTVSESAGLLAQAVPRLDGLSERVAELAGRLDTRSGANTGGPSAGEDAIVPVPWPALTAEHAEVEWNRLGEWVATVLGPWYQVTRGQVPDCWALHRPVLLQLSWLHQAYVAAHTGPGASATAAAEWHVRWLPSALDAIAHAAPYARVKFDYEGGGPWERACHPGFHLDERPGQDRKEAKARPARRYEAPDDYARMDRPASMQPTVDLVHDPIEFRFWGEFWRQAMRTDVEARRHREPG